MSNAAFAFYTRFALKIVARGVKKIAFIFVIVLGRAEEAT